MPHQEVMVGCPRAGRGGGGGGNCNPRMLTVHECKPGIWKWKKGFFPLKVGQNIFLYLVLFSPRILQLNGGYDTKAQEMFNDLVLMTIQVSIV